jgi:DNA-binding GntR family transcriptional regulator
MPVYAPEVDEIQQIDPHGPDWPYIQLADILRQVVAGMRPHQRLPSIRTLSQTYELSEKTVRKALKVLEDETPPRVYARRTRGMFVSPP